MSNGHSLTGEHVLRAVYNSEDKALTAKMLPMEMAVELSHEDGDSILAHKAVKQLTLSANVAGNVLGHNRLSVYSAANTPVYVAADSAQEWILLGNTNAVGLLSADVCANFIKCNANCKVVAI
jgi:Rod binding domain-containing protein